MSSEIWFPPYNFIIENRQYILKGRYSNGNCSYRCPHRNNCKIIIRITKDELIKKTNNNEEKIQYTIVSTQKAHSCNDENTDIINNGNLSSLTNTTNLARALIKQNITRKLSFHVNLLNKAKIPLTKRQIKKLLQDIRNESLPNDTEFFRDLSSIKITLEDTIAELKDLPFFFCQETIINIYKNNKVENYIIFSTPFHIKLFSEAKQIFIDATFNCPSTYFFI